MAFVFPGLWLAWCVYWAVSAKGVKAAERRESLGSRLLHIVPLAFAAWLLATPRTGGALASRLFPWSPWQFWLGAVLAAAGLAFSVWARVHLGRNWSGSVTIKEEHELVTSGPYAIVRHPIYTGLLVALAGSAFAWGDARSAAALVIAVLALWRKLRIEERWMRERFGDRYRAYAERVPALIPLA